MSESIILISPLKGVTHVLGVLIKTNPNGSPQKFNCKIKDEETREKIENWIPISMCVCVSACVYQNWMYRLIGFLVLHHLEPDGFILRIVDNRFFSIGGVWWCLVFFSFNFYLLSCIWYLTIWLLCRKRIFWEGFCWK